MNRTRFQEIPDTILIYELHPSAASLFCSNKYYNLLCIVHGASCTNANTERVHRAGHQRPIQFLCCTELHQLCKPPSSFVQDANVGVGIPEL